MIFRPQIMAALMGLVLLGIVWSAIQAWMPFSPNSFHADSHSGRMIGHRAVYELLDALGAEVHRSPKVPELLFEGRRRVLLIEPDIMRLERERSYLVRMSEWLESGGELVAVLGDLSWKEDDEEEVEDPDEENPLREILGKNAFVEQLGVEKLDIVGEEPDFGEPGEHDYWAQTVRYSLLPVRRPEAAYTVDASGSLGRLSEWVAELKLPGESLKSFSGEGMKAALGMIEVTRFDETGDKEAFPIALEFEKGQGRVILVSEPVLFQNHAIREADNAVLAYHLAAGNGDRPVYLDEFYHGAFMGMNTFALLGSYPYSLIGISALIATLLWAWSQGVRFGPPLRLRPPSRRTMLEYVQAMARLFQRGRKYAFILETCRDGVLDEVRHELRMPHGSAHETVLQRLAVRQAQRAERLRRVLATIDATLASSEYMKLSTLTEIHERLESCRNQMGSSPQLLKK